MIHHTEATPAEQRLAEGIHSILTDGFLDRFLMMPIYLTREREHLRPSGGSSVSLFDLESLMLGELHRREFSVPDAAELVACIDPAGVLQFELHRAPWETLRGFR